MIPTDNKHEVEVEREIGREWLPTNRGIYQKAKEWLPRLHAGLMRQT